MLVIVVMPVVMTSSPGPMPSAMRASSSASVPDDTATACATPICAASSRREAGSSPGPSSASAAALPDYTHGVPAFPRILSPYRPAPIQRLRLENSPRLRDRLRDGHLRLSLADALALALRLDCPIYVEEQVLKTSKVTTTTAEKVTNEELKKWLEGLNDEDLGRYKM